MNQIKLASPAPRVRPFSNSGSRRARPEGNMSENVLSYRDVRSQIAAGDLLLYRGAHPLSYVIRWITKSEFSHSGMISWWSPLNEPECKRLMVFEATHPYVTLHPASESVGTYNGSVVWYQLKPEHRKTLDTRQLHQAAEERLGLFFSNRGLFDYLFHWMGLGALAADRRWHAKFCSEYVSECFTKASMDPDLNNPSHFTSPQDLAKSRLWSRKGVLHLDLHQERERRSIRRDQQRKDVEQQRSNAAQSGPPSS